MEKDSGILSRFGSHLTERLTKAEELRREQERPRTADETVTEAVLGFERMEEVAQQLSRALQKAIAGADHRAQAIIVTVVPDLQAELYEITVTLPPSTLPMATFAATPPPKAELHFVLHEEDLLKNTRGVKLFHAWINAVAQRIVILLGFRRPERSESSGGWLEVNLSPVGRPSEEVKRQRYEELESFGLRPGRRTPLGIPVDIEEERAAIESIRREINGRPNGAKQ